MYFLLKGFAEKVQLMENIARCNIPAICHCYVCFEKPSALNTYETSSNILPYISTSWKLVVK